jgi:VPDSG-CTERM motif
MTRKIILLLVAAAGAFALKANALPVTIHFQESGDVGPTFTFDQDGFDLTLSAFLTAGGTTHLFVANAAGTTGDPSGQNGIATNTFIQLTVPTSPASNLDFVSIGDIGAGESAKVYFTTTAGSLAGATLLKTLTADGPVAVGAAFQHGFIDITAGAGNVLLTGAQISQVRSVPDAGFTASLLGMGLVGLAALRRKLHV